MRPLTGRLPPGPQGRVRRLPPGMAADVRPAYCARAQRSGRAADAGARPLLCIHTSYARLPVAVLEACIGDLAWSYHARDEPVWGDAGGGLRAGGPAAEPLRRAVRLLLCGGRPEVRSPKESRPLATSWAGSRRVCCPGTRTSARVS